MRYIASSIFFGLGVYLLHFYHGGGNEFVLAFDPKDTYYTSISAFCVFPPILISLYLLVTAERDRRAGRRSIDD